MAQRAHEQRAEEAKQDEGAAKRNQEAQADTRKVARGARTRKRRSSTAQRPPGKSPQRRGGVEDDKEQRYTKRTAHVGRANGGTKGDRHVGRG